MQLLELMRSRHSIRGYSNREIEKEKLDYVIEAFRVAPSAKNIQPWHLVVVNDRGIINKLVPACNNQAFIAEAPIVIAVIGDEENAYGRMGGYANSLFVDIGIALEHLILAAWEKGLGTCWIGAFKEEEVKGILNIPKDLRVVALTPLGYPDAEPRDRGRKSVREIVHYNRF
ncbi:MAG: nitroreductase family protein [Actinobacteria bacterium]|nr:nitroreductase family protein [Actinomycetota bacterium]